ncbi:MAG: MaoC/PaaZ C-terminal domain-containing protein [Gordonia sp. (in: high G+C Gram-positive bacteria)]|uniref:MaoC/PaaZ C-terminal domain-containing protein n=1 Tax=Gordonia sp. (in: high G+C Gram-positive bacteria) TaxID=84139 RepID=UPI003C74C86A
MPVLQTMAGLTGPAASDVLDDRWVMNYFAAVGDSDPRYFDNRGDTPLPAHAAYVSHLEWDAIGLLHEAHLEALTPAERVRGVHSFNSTRLHRPLRSGDALSSTATVVGVERRRAGAKITMRIDTVDDAGTAVATSYTATNFLGVDADGDVLPPEVRLSTAAAGAEPVRTEDIEIGPLAPYVFSECARDYGIIHTDLKVATAAGFPGLILHGTGNIAYAVSSLTRHECGGDPTRVRGFQARLTGMVLCPSTMTVRVFDSTGDDAVHFDVLTDSGEVALADGILLIGDPA